MLLIFSVWFGLLKTLGHACPTLDKESVWEDTEAERRLGKGCYEVPFPKSWTENVGEGRAGWEPRRRDSRCTVERRAKMGWAQAGAEAVEIKSGGPRAGDTKSPACGWVSG